MPTEQEIRVAARQAGLTAGSAYRGEEDYATVSRNDVELPSGLESRTSGLGAIYITEYMAAFNKGKLVNARDDVVSYIADSPLPDELTDFWKQAYCSVLSGLATGEDGYGPIQGSRVAAAWADRAVLALAQLQSNLLAS